MSFCRKRGCSAKILQKLLFRLFLCPVFVYNIDKSLQGTITFWQSNIQGGICMKPIIIGIAGGTGSGKSTFTNRLHDAFGEQVAVLYHDNYYRCNDDISFEERKN